MAVRLSAVDWTVERGVLSGGAEVAVLTIYTGAGIELPVVLPRGQADDVCRAIAACFDPPEPPAAVAKPPLLAVHTPPDEFDSGSVGCVAGGSVGIGAPGADDGVGRMGPQ